MGAAVAGLVVELSRPPLRSGRRSRPAPRSRTVGSITSRIVVRGRRSFERLADGEGGSCRRKPSTNTAIACGWSPAGWKSEIPLEGSADPPGAGSGRGCRAAPSAGRAPASLRRDAWGGSAAVTITQDAWSAMPTQGPVCRGRQPDASPPAPSSGNMACSILRFLALCAARLPLSPDLRSTRSAACYPQRGRTTPTETIETGAAIRLKQIGFMISKLAFDA